MAKLTVTLRRCIGSARFAIEPHDAPVDDFPRQPSQKDSLGRMCKTHWNAYTAGLARDAKARKTATGQEAAPVEADQPRTPATASEKPKARRSPKRAAEVAPATNGASGE